MSHAQETGEVDAPGAHRFAEFRVVGTTIHYRVTVRHLTGPATMAHIHAPGERHANAAIDIWLCGTPALPGPSGTPACSATTDGLFEGSVTATLLQLDRLEAGLGYANVHTAATRPEK